MSEKIKEYSQNLKVFQYLSYLIFFMSMVYVINNINPNDKNILSQVISIALLGLFASGFLFYFGKKKRSIILYNDKIEYIKSNVEFSAYWKDIILVKSFKEINRTSENLILLKDDEEVFSISTAFFDKKKLIEVFKEIVSINQNNKSLTIEDDRNWLN